MVEATVILSIGGSLVVGVLYFMVARAVMQRHLKGSVKLANYSYGTWWLVLAAVSILGGLATLIGVFDWWSLPAYLTYMQVILWLIVLALGSLQFYFMFLYTGKATMIWPIIAFYGALWIGLIYWIYWSEPIALIEGAQGVELDYVQDPSESPFATLLGVLLVFPAMVAIAFYVRLYTKVDSSLQKFRIAAVSASIFVWFTFSFVGSLTGTSREVWWAVASQLVGMSAAIVNLIAYRPPAKLRRRLDPESLVPE